MNLKHFPVAVFGLIFALFLLSGQTLFFGQTRDFVIDFIDTFSAEKPLSSNNFERGIFETKRLIGLTANSYQAAAVATVSDGAGWWSQFLDFLVETWNEIKQNWRSFWGGRVAPSSSSDSPSVATTSIDLSDVKKELLVELRSEIKKQVDQARSNEGSANRGVVVVPPGQSAQGVAEMFSDPVRVQMDSTGQSGVVTPVFRDKQGESFIFLLTPIKR